MPKQIGSCRKLLRHIITQDPDEMAWQLWRKQF